MLGQLELSNFKCFESLKLHLGSLTLLSGTNASGKSSVLQSLVLLHQTMKENEWSTRLTLNGKVTQLGTVTDVVDQITGKDRFGIGLIDNDTSCQLDICRHRYDMSLEVNRVELTGNAVENPSTCGGFCQPMRMKPPGRWQIES